MRRFWVAGVVLGVLEAAWLLAVVPPATRAENLGPGGGSRIIVGDEIVGPYRLLVTVAPEPAQVGVVTFVVRISDPASDEKVRDADVTVELVHSEDGTVLTGAATHQNSGNPIDYAAHMQIEKAGTYNATIRIGGPAGPTEVTFTQKVVARRGLGTLLLIGVPFVVVLGILASVWLKGSRRSPLGEPSPQEERSS
jgi:YtkA-like